ncbi:HAMP domain-containing protein, partial [Bradyrhizobium ottawaense]
DAALQAAKDHSAAQRAAAVQLLIVNTALLVAAIVLTGAAMLAVSRRVITPLHRIRDAMLRVAGGNLTVDSGYLDRRDEIGSLAGALETFKQQ